LAHVLGYPRTNKLTSEARTEGDEAKRTALYTQMQEKFLSSTPPLFAIAAATQPSAVRSNVEALTDQQSRSPQWYLVSKSQK
jgi:peptide/nickel transport system substrate-binding protein